MVYFNGTIQDLNKIVNHKAPFNQKEELTFTCRDCGKESTELYRNLRKRPDVICKKCAKKRTIISNYGDWDTYVKEMQAKKEDTFLKKYGVKNTFQSEEVKEKIKKTNLAKYGSEKASQNPEVKKKQSSSLKLNKEERLTKTKATNLAKYGVENQFQRQEVREAFKEKYGVDNPSQLTWVREKARETC